MAVPLIAKYIGNINFIRRGVCKSRRGAITIGTKYRVGR